MLTARLPLFTRTALAVLAMLSAALAPAGIAHADDPPPGGLGTSVGVVAGPDGVTTTVGTGSNQPGSGSNTGSSGNGGGGGSAPPCRYELDDDYEPPVGEIDPHAGEDGAYYLKICGPHVTPGEPLSQLLISANTTVTLIWIPARLAPPVTVSPQALAAQASRFLPLPAPQVHHNPTPAAVVNLPTWLWVDARSWGARRSFAAVPGLSVTVLATPTTVTWRLDPQRPPLHCRGAGKPYRSDRAARSQKPSCAFGFTRTSRQQHRQVFASSATSNWQISWRASTGVDGSLPALQRTSTFDLPVREVQTVITGAH